MALKRLSLQFYLVVLLATGIGAFYACEKKEVVPDQGTSQVVLSDLDKQLADDPIFEEFIRISQKFTDPLKEKRHTLSSDKFEALLKAIQEAADEENLTEAINLMGFENEAEFYKIKDEIVKGYAPLTEKYPELLQKSKEELEQTFSNVIMDIGVSGYKSWCTMLCTAAYTAEGVIIAAGLTICLAAAAAVIIDGPLLEAACIALALGLTAKAALAYHNCLNKCGSGSGSGSGEIVK